MHFHVPPNDSPVWPFARFAWVTGLLFLMLTVNYNRFDVRDIGTILTVCGGLGFFDGLKVFTSHPPTPKEIAARDEVIEEKES